MNKLCIKKFNKIVVCYYSMDTPKTHERIFISEKFSNVHGKSETRNTIQSPDRLLKNYPDKIR